MEIDLDNLLGIDDIIPTPEYIETALGLLQDKTKVITSLNLTSFCTKQSAKEIFEIFQNEVTNLQTKCTELSDQLIRVLKNSGMVKPTDIDSLTDSIGFLITYINAKDYSTVEKYKKCATLTTLDDIVEACNYFIADFKINDIEVKTYDDVYSLVNSICVKEGIKII